MKKWSENGYNKDSMATLLEGLGKPLWSKSAGKMMFPSSPRAIDPQSPEGREIARKYLRQNK